MKIKMNLVEQLNDSDFYRYLIKNPYGLMYFMDILGFNVCPFGDDNGNAYGVSWCTVDANKHKRWNEHRFDKKDWKEFWKMRNRIIKERLFHR